MARVGLFGQISEINDHLFLSGAGVLRPEKLKQKGITCVVNATIEEPTAHLPGVDCVRIRIEDSPYAQLSNYFDLVADKVRSTKDRGGKTLVHCVAGVSRSATLCIVYLVKYERMNLRQAYHYVKSARPIVRPNLGFWQQMVEYERKLRGHSTVTMIPAEGSAFAFPDVYSQDLRKHILSHPGPPQHDPSLIALQKRLREREQQRESSNAAAATRMAKLIPIQLVGASTANGGGSLASRLGASSQRRAFGNGTTDSSLRHRHSSSALPSRSTNTTTTTTNNNNNQQQQQNGTINSALPWRMSSLFSPAPGRRSAAATYSIGVGNNGLGGGGGGSRSGGGLENGSNGGIGLFGVPSPFQQPNLFSAF